MVAYVGNAALIEWIGTGGTTTVSTDFRTSGLNEVTSVIDTTAGADTDAEHLAHLKSGGFSLDLVRQADGTAIETALANGAVGTVIHSPEGTASGKRKYTLPCTITGASHSQPYNDISSHSISFTFNGAITKGNY